MERHKVFISYHHENDQKYKNKFLHLFGEDGANILVNHSVDTGDIDATLSTETIRLIIRDEYIRDATVVIVLVGDETWKRKHVDWEISSGIRDTKRNPRCGLLGIFLPTHPDYQNNQYDTHTIPPRLHYNIEAGYAKLYKWTNNANTISQRIHEAFENRKKTTSDHSRVMFSKNRTGERWHD